MEKNILKLQRCLKTSMVFFATVLIFIGVCFFGLGLLTKPSIAADLTPRDLYWVNGTGNWSDMGHWALTSGDTNAGADIPTSIDNVFIDSNSGFGGGGTITIDSEANVECHDFTSNSGFTYTLQDTGQNHNYGLTCYGSLTLESGFTYIASAITLSSVDAGETLTFGGATILDAIRIIGEGGSWTLQDDLVLTGTTGSFYQESGTFDANDNNITANNFYFYTGAANPVVIMGSGTWDATGTGQVWFIDEYPGYVVTITSETSTIKLSDTGATATNKEFNHYFDDAVPLTGKIYNNIWVTGSGTGKFYFDTGSNTFNDFKVDTPPHTIRFRGGETQTVSTFTVSGTSGNLITIDSVDEATQHTLSKSSGVVSCDYLDISNSNAIGGATWYAGSHSNDTNNNSGWIFEDAPTPTATPTQTSNPSVAGNVSDGLGCGSHDCSNITTTRRSTSTANPVPNSSTTSTPTATGVQLFDIALTIENNVLGASSELIARIQFTSFGTVPTAVNMVYRIEDAGGKEVFSEKNDVTVETEQLVTKEFKSLALGSGKYTLVLSTTYGNNVQDEFKQAFEVKGISSNVVWVISVPIIAGGVIVFLFIKRKRKQKMST